MDANAANVDLDYVLIINHLLALVKCECQIYDNIVKNFVKGYFHNASLDLARDR